MYILVTFNYTRKLTIEDNYIILEFYDKFGLKIHQIHKINEDTFIITFNNYIGTFYIYNTLMGFTNYFLR